MKQIKLLLFIILINCVQTKAAQDSASPGIYDTKPGASLSGIADEAQSEPQIAKTAQGIKGLEVQENTKPFSKVADASDPSRYIKIKVSPEIASEEIDFWARQMSEHALFNHLGFEEARFKQEAKELHDELESFRSDFNDDPTNIKLMNSLLPILKKQRAFQIKALKAMNSGKWIGWIFPVFENHITLELDYFVDKLNGLYYSPKDEVSFWNRNSSEDVGLTAHLLDPSEQKLIKQANNLSEKFNKIPKTEKDLMLKLSLTASKELDKFNKDSRANSKNIKSIIHPVLLDHVIREGERAIKTLTDLGLHKESAELKVLNKNELSQYKESATKESEDVE